jgi:photosystem II stability/assembly factor-like uncharacterized protein
LGTERGVFKSEEGGKNWKAVNTGLPITRVRALTFHPAQSKTLFVEAGGNIFKSMDGGETWNPMKTGLIEVGVKALVIDPVTPNRLYVGTEGNGVFIIPSCPF